MDTTCVMCRAKPGDRQSTAGRWFCDTCVSSLPSEQDTLAALNGEIEALTAERDALEKRAIHAEEQFGLMRDERDALKAALENVMHNYCRKCGQCYLCMLLGEARRLLGMEG